jgi:hypothetical protein
MFLGGIIISSRAELPSLQPCNLVTRTNMATINLQAILIKERSNRDLSPGIKRKRQAHLAPHEEYELG